MNFCNFAKVLLCYASKDSSAIEWWRNERKDKEDVLVHKFNHNLSYTARLQNYNEFVENNPKLKIDSTTFQYSIKRLQDYFKITKYWKHDNKNQEKQNFLENFSVQKWYYFHKE